MLKIQKLSVSYPGKTVIKDLDLEIPEGKLLILTGPNGSGKSTLLKAIDGLIDNVSGQILFQGQDLLSMEPKDRAKTAAYLSQNRAVPSITAERLVLHGRFPYLHYPRRYSKEDWSIVKASLQRADAADLAKENLQQLSGGQRQKVYIAMALAQTTPIILMDEPTTFLDISHQLSLMTLAKELAQEGKTVIMVLHDLRLAMTYADLISVCCNGTVSQPQSPEELFDSPLWKKAFGIGLQRLRTPSGWEYYYERI